ncbi:MAG: carboxymuconolactone decarboxylase family protein [Thermoanaerobaculia bacterium]|nr:carboxymuconolactone decarboxylase family protein [Thermoanaerobaculia bacterium]
MSRESDFPEPPNTYTEFVGRFPKLGKAWSTIAEAGRSGPLDGKTRRLIKLAVAIGAMREGAVHASVRKALSLGITEEELDQVVALSASTLGMPSTVACYTWVHDVVDD